jgi:hypothetical protein
MHERVPAVERKLADGKSVVRGKNVNWTVIVIEGMKLLDNSVTVIATGIGMALARRRRRRLYQRL